ncbi:hypothetical protein FQN49_008400 [Arthroderma sp. PD_2]|nr:hypothetical protein FQN49_008400 [Arthroderma sp. PD_2]
MAPLRRKRQRTPDIQLKSKKKKLNHVPDAKTAQQSKEVQRSKTRYQLTKGALQKLHDSNLEAEEQITRPREKRKQRFEYEFAPDYLESCGPKHLEQIKQVALQGGHDLSSLRSIFRPYRIQDKEREEEDEDDEDENDEEERGERVDEEDDGEDEGDEDADVNGGEADLGLIGRLEGERNCDKHAMEYVSQCHNECSVDIPQPDGGSVARLPSPNPSQGMSLPPVYFPIPPHLDMSNLSQIRAAIEDGNCIMNTLLNRLEAIAGEQPPIINLWQVQEQFPQLGDYS